LIRPAGRNILPMADSFMLATGRRHDAMFRTQGTNFAQIRDGRHFNKK
jgi:hypothetical protein